MKDPMRPKSQLQKLYAFKTTQWLMALLIFVFFSWFYMGPSLTSCNSVTSAFNSDTTGGMAWYQWAGGNDLSWGYTTKSNFPIGEALYRPQFITSEAFTTPYKVISSVTSPVCGVNIMILGGYLSTALVMFGLVLWLTKRSSIAVFAGYAAAFIPFHQLKAQSHIVYIYGSVFAAILWAYFWYLNRPRLRRILPLAALVAIGVYIDGYFILLSGILTMSLLISLLMHSSLGITHKKGLFSLNFSAKQVWGNCKVYIKHLLFALLALLIFLIPVIYKQLTSGNEIRNSLSAARGNIQLEALTYGARPVEYLLPAFNNALVPASYTAWRLNHQHYSNPSEDTLYLGLTVVVLAAIAIYIWLKSSVRKLNLTKNLTYGHVVGTTIFALLVCFVFSLPSRFNFLGHRFPTPVGVLIDLTANWRVFSRFVIVISPLCVLLASLALWYHSEKFSRRKFYILISVCFAILFLEFLPKPLQPHGDYNTQTPKIYETLRADKSVNTIAEYPLTDLLYVPSVFTFQPVHGKNVINANDSGIARDQLNLTTFGIGDSQTQSVLRARGVQVITSYGTDFSKVANLEQYSPVDTSTKQIGLPPIYSYWLSRSVPVASVALVRDKGFDFPWLDESLRAHHQMASRGTMELVDATGRPAKLNGNFAIQFTVGVISKAQAGLVISQNERVIWSDTVSTPQTVDLTVEGGHTINLQASEPIDFTSLSATAQ